MYQIAYIGRWATLPETAAAIYEHDILKLEELLHDGLVWLSLVEKRFEHLFLREIKSLLTCFLKRVRTLLLPINTAIVHILWQSKTKIRKWQTT